jgi:RsiW-degrading membrane proteinase PrsW (M82 family)
MADLSEMLGVGLGGAEMTGLTTGILILIIVIAIWKLIWYGIAIYKTIERKQIRWFVVLFVAAFLLGDLGILAIIYLLIHKNKGQAKAKEEKPAKPEKKKKK